MNILLLDGIDPVCSAIFKERGITAVQPSIANPDELKKMIGNYEGVVVRSATTVDDELLKHAKKLKVVGRAGVGVDNIDIKAATSRGVLVMNTPDGNTISTAEHTCGLILALSRNIPDAVAGMKAGAWDRKKFMGNEVSGKTLGIVGLGKIGSEVALRMQAFGMKCIAYDPFATHEHAADIGIELMDLDSVLSQADFLTVHTPLTDKTRGMISLKNSEKLKKGMRLINCARGGIYTESDLIPLIEQGFVSGVALDVYSEEPPTKELYEILKHPAIICTPHLGASTGEAQEKVAVQIAEQMADALENKNFKGSLNSKSIAMLSNPDVHPYLELAEKMGRMVSGVAPDNTRKFSFEYHGSCSKFSDILTDSILKGVLSEFVDESVNLINARVYAEDRGLKITETKSSEGSLYRDLITIRLEDGAEYNEISAAVFGPGDYRIVRINGYGIELRLEGDILLYQNPDVPGMLAAVAGTLAKQNVNIGALGLGRTAKGENAITAVIIDKKMDKNDIIPIAELDGVKAVKYISLTD